MKSKLIYTSLVAVTMLLGSCKDEFFDQEPYNALPIATAVTTEAELGAAVNGMYQSLRTPNSFGRNIPIMGDLMADNIYIAPTNSGRYLTQNAYAATGVSAEPTGIWAALYTSILRANTVINTIVPASPVVDQLKGEAYAVRALNHFELVKFFATPYTVNPNAPGVPVVTFFDPLSPTSYYAGFLPKRNTVKEVYDQIIADLDQAFTLMNTAKNSSFINKYAAKALQARAYLFMGEYEKARDAALEVVNNGGYTLVPAASYVAYWANPAATANKVETIFEIGLDFVNNNGFDALANMYDQAQYGDMLATDQLYNLYETTDVRKSVIRVGVRGNVNPAYIVTKYSNSSSASDRDDVKVIRYAEVLLTLAESYARTGNEPQALVVLNQVVTARGATPYVSVGEQLINDIVTERRKELAFEGLRYWDLMRLNLPIVRTEQHPESARLITVDNPERIQPIPQGELDANPNMEPNPGYQ